RRNRDVLVWLAAPLIAGEGERLVARDVDVADRVVALREQPRPGRIVRESGRRDVDLVFTVFSDEIEGLVERLAASLQRHAYGVALDHDLRDLEPGELAVAEPERAHQRRALLVGECVEVHAALEGVREE